MSKTLTVHDFVEAETVARDADTTVSDVAADLLADGVSLSELARSLGITRQSVTERIAATPGRRELLRAWSRVQAWYPDKEPRGVRLSTVGRLVVFAMDTAIQEHSMQPEPTVWRVLRHTTQPADAEALAAFLAREGDGAFKYVRRPRDLDPANVLPWRL